MAEQQPKSPADAKLDAAIAAAGQQPMATLSIKLAPGRTASVQFPIPLSPDEALRITGAFTHAYLQQFDSERATAVQGDLIVPGRPA